VPRDCRRSLPGAAFADFPGLFAEIASNLPSAKPTLDLGREIIDVEYKFVAPFHGVC
jgi:hypothetical protein